MFSSLHPKEMVSLQKYSEVMRIDRPKLARMKLSQAQRIRISAMLTLNTSLSRLHQLRRKDCSGALEN